MSSGRRAHGECTMLQELLGGDVRSIISAISSKVGASEAQAGGFLDQALTMIEQAIASGKLDMDALLKGDLSSLTSALDMGSLGQLLGGGEGEAQQGLDAMIGPLKDKLAGQGDLSAMLGNLTGQDGGQAVGDLMGKLGGMFGKK